MEKMKAPDGSYDVDLVLPGTTDEEWKQHNGESPNPNVGMDGLDGGMRSPLASTARSMNLELNNPLSLHNEVS